DRGHRLRRCPPIGAVSHRTRRHCAATSTSGSPCGHGPLTPTGKPPPEAVAYLLGVQAPDSKAQTAASFPAPCLAPPPGDSYTAVVRRSHASRSSMGPAPVHDGNRAGQRKNALRCCCIWPAPLVFHACVRPCGRCVGWVRRCGKAGPPAWQGPHANAVRKGDGAMSRLDGKVALISGGGRGQGAAEAKLFAREGAKVVLGDILDEAGKQVEEEIRQQGGEATYVHLDVTSEAEWVEAVGTAVNRYGKLDILVNNAGISG